MGFDDLLDQVGGVGKFQVIQLVFLAIPICFTTPQLLLENFSGAIPAHRCRIPLLDNHTGSSGVLGNLSTEALLRVSIPLDQNQKLEKCHRFSQTQWPLLTENGTGPQPHEPATEPCEDGWVYDRSVFTSTFVTEWDLVCELLPQKAMSQSIYMAGILLGSIIYGHISDRFGRKSVLIWAYLQLGMASTGVAFSPTLTIYRLLRFLSAFALAGIMINTGSLILEWTPTVSRAFFMMMFVACYSVGHLVLAGFAYAIRDWRSLQVAVSVPFFAIFLYSWGYAESARWLSMAGRPGQALKELRKVARINRKAVAKGCLTIEMLRSLSQDELTAAKSHYTVIDLFRLPALRRISCCITLASPAGPACGICRNWNWVSGNGSQLHHPVCGRTVPHRAEADEQRAGPRFEAHRRHPGSSLENNGGTLLTSPHNFLRSHPHHCWNSGPLPPRDPKPTAARHHPGCGGLEKLPATETPRSQAGRLL
ncbi:steroid transmembrane transporter SLC22A24-like isoform X4 [Ornithorhynchus anatinus]|uniref:steroid transmembrane transporter SLC22A24-like isoform X4 n=1 Tax=Ornithorhynchus anatinus TaxID=9258 RepID=UPI0004541BA4|nr:steroid transmembrane transporter SLC22A24-like isoform X4 [Ornithorhynchus anatinus]